MCRFSRGGLAAVLALGCLQAASGFGLTASSIGLRGIAGGQATKAVMHRAKRHVAAIRMQVWSNNEAIEQYRNLLSGKEEIREPDR